MPSQKINAGMLVIILVLLAGCSAHSSSPAASAHAPQLPITIRSADAWATRDQKYQVSVSASCLPGEQMLGGGFGASDVFEYAASISASYPSSANTWTVSGSSISTFQLSAEVYCAPASTSLGIQRAQSASSGAGHVACPQGTVLLSGGFQGGQRVSIARPQGNGWEGNSEQVYALCAAQHVAAGTLATSSFRVQSSSTGYQPGGGDVRCPAGQVATGGGFAGGSAILASRLETTDAHPSGWGVTAGGDTEVVVYAVCRDLT